MDGSIQFRSVVRRYGLALLLVAIAALIRHQLAPVIGSLTPLLFFTAAQVAVALLAGRGPALFALLLGTAVGYLLFLQPSHVLANNLKLYYLFLNVSVSGALIWIADAVHRGRQEAHRREN